MLPEYMIVSSSGFRGVETEAWLADTVMAVGTEEKGIGG
jgi:hypothetical protein